MRSILRRFFAVFFAALVLGAALPAMAFAATGSKPTNRGLYVTPVRQFIAMDAGTTKSSNITVGNFTDNPMVVKFSVKAFTVSDYSYGFEFEDAPVGRVDFDIDSVSLKPNESRTVPFQIELPDSVQPGGQYYTLFATGTGASGQAAQQVQATSLVYLTVNGALIRSGGLEDSSIDRFTFRPQIHYSLDIANTGNVHYFAALNARINQPVGKDIVSSETHLLLPHKTRHFEASIKSPVLPGIYRVTYGYTPQDGEPVTRSSYVAYLPPWALAAFVILIWLVWIIRQRLRKLRRRRRLAAEDSRVKDDGDATD